MTPYLKVPMTIVSLHHGTHVIETCFPSERRAPTHGGPLGTTVGSHNAVCNTVNSKPKLLSAAGPQEVCHSVLCILDFSSVLASRSVGAAVALDRDGGIEVCDARPEPPGSRIVEPRCSQAMVAEPPS